MFCFCSSKSNSVINLPLRENIFCDLQLHNYGIRPTYVDVCACNDRMLVSAWNFKSKMFPRLEGKNHFDCVIYAIMLGYRIKKKVFYVQKTSTLSDNTFFTGILSS